MLPVFGSFVAVLALLLPGALFLSRGELRRADPIELCGKALCVSAAFWAVAIWYQPYLRLSLSTLFVLITLAAVAILAVCRRSDLAAALGSIRTTPHLLVWGTVFVLLVVASRFALATTRIAGSVGDMTAHTTMAELIFLANGMPSSHEPLLPISDFGQFAPGFHTLAAMLSLLTGVPTYRSAVFALCLALCALTLALYVVLKRLGLAPSFAALGAAGAMMLAHNPQSFAQWGGAPSLLAAALALCLLADCIRLAETGRWNGIPRMALLAAGAVLTHLLPVAGFLYMGPAVLLVYAVSARKRIAHLVGAGSLAALVAFALVLPSFRITPLAPTPGIVEWARAWFRTEVAGALPLQQFVLEHVGLSSVAVEIGAHTWPFHLVVYLGLLPTGLLIAGLGWGWLRRRDQATFAATAVLVVHFGLFTAAFSESVPLWSAFYPTRIGVWLPVALGVALATLASVLASKLSRNALGALALCWLLVFSLEGWRLSEFKFERDFGTGYYEAVRTGEASPAAVAAAVAARQACGRAFWITTLSRDNAVLGRDDLRAFSWIRNNTPCDAVFVTNYGDGGNLIGAVAHRKVLNPHYYWFFYEAEYEAWRTVTEPTHAYVGSTPSPAYPRELTAGGLDDDPNAELVFRSGEARVYRLAGADAPASQP
jgi:hypothetical protein